MAHKKLITTLKHLSLWCTAVQNISNKIEILTCRLTMVPNLLKCSLSLLMLLSRGGICRTSSLVLREKGSLLW